MIKQILLITCFACCITMGWCQQAKVVKGKTEGVVFRNSKNTSVPHMPLDVLGKIDPADAEKLDAINIKDFGSAMPEGESVEANARVMSNEDTARGTNVAPALRAAIKAARIGQFIIIGPGEWVVSTPIELPVAKQINLICIGNLHFNKRDGFRINTPVGMQDPQHHLMFYGTLIGSENLPRHTKATHDAGTQPNWAAMKNTAVDITNCSRNFILINRAEGFGNAVRINGGMGNGAQENTVSFQFFYKNANGITLRSLDGHSYVDKNIFMGFYGGAGRITGGLAINIDGYEGIAHNGERYNGSFQSNEFHFLVEQVDSIIVANGDVREPLFDIVVEGGDKTGVFGNNAFQMRSEAPNFVRSPIYCGSGMFRAEWLAKGLGVNGQIIGLPVYHKQYILLGTNGKTDNKGNVILESKTQMTLKQKDGLPKNIRLE